MTLKILIFLFFSFKVLAHTVLIDPGHGGEELGATVTIPFEKTKTTLQEKDLALTLGKKIKKILSKDHSTYLTRSIDRTLSLQDRADVADKIKADLFVSLHFNSNPSGKYEGFEVYYLNNHKDQAVKKVEGVENEGLKGEALVVNQILIDLIIDKTSTDSKRLAFNIHKQIRRTVKNHYKLRDRGVKPGLFYVLALSKRPAALVEVGFLSNMAEAQKIKDDKFLDDYAVAISEGIKNYLKTVKKKKLPLF